MKMNPKEIGKRIQLLAIWDKNGYHSIVNRHRVTCVCEQ